MRNVSGKVVEKTKVHFILNSFFFDNSAVCDSVEKYYRAWQFRDGNMMHVHGMLDT